MLDADISREITTDLLDRLSGVDRQVSLFGGQHDEVVFANDKVVSSRQVVELGARLSVAQKREAEWFLAVATTNRLDDESLQRLLERLEPLFEVVSPDAQYKTLPYPDTFEYPDQTVFDAAVGRTGPAFRLDQITRIAMEFERHGWQTTGRYLQCEGGIDAQRRTSDFAVASSRGVFAHHRGTLNQLAIRLAHPDAPRWADVHVFESGARAGIDAEQIAETLLQTLEPLLGSSLPLQTVSECPEGLPILFDRPAIATIVSALTPSFSGASSIVGSDDARLNHAVFDAAFTLRCNVHHAELGLRAFDVLGIPTQTVDLVSGGALAERVWSWRSARATERTPTGHSLSFTQAADRPVAPCVEGTDTDDATLVAGLDDAICIRDIRVRHLDSPFRLHVSAPSGALRIRNGKLDAALEPLAFVIDLQTFFSRIEALGVASRSLGTVVPPMVIPGEQVGQLAAYRPPQVEQMEQTP